MVVSQIRDTPIPSFILAIYSKNPSKPTITFGVPWVVTRPAQKLIDITCKMRRYNTYLTSNQEDNTEWPTMYMHRL